MQHLALIRYAGPKCTCVNGREGSDFIKEHLDSGVANGNWRELFQDAEIRAGMVGCFDHALLFLYLFGENGKQCGRPNWFRYESSWVHNCSDPNN